MIIKEVDACRGWTPDEHEQGVVAVNVIGRTLDVTGHTSITYASHLHDPVYAHYSQPGTTDAHCDAMCYPPTSSGRARTLAPNFRRHSSVSPVAIACCSVAFWIFVRGSSRNTGNNAGDKAGHYSSCDIRVFRRLPGDSRCSKIRYVLFRCLVRVLHGFVVSDIV